MKISEQLKKDLLEKFAQQKSENEEKVELLKAEFNRLLDTYPNFENSDYEDDLLALIDIMKDMINLQSDLVGILEDD